MEENRKFTIVRIVLGIALCLPPLTWIRIISFAVLAYPVILNAVKNIFKGKLFDETFLMTVASAGAIFLGDITEAVFIMLLYTIGEFLQDLIADKASDEISALASLTSETARITDESGKTTLIPAENLKKDDCFVILPGEKSGTDGKVIFGTTYIDISSITGESEPVLVSPGQSIMSGSIVLDGSITVKAETDSSQSTISKVKHYIEQATATKAKTEKFMNRFSEVYTPVVCLLAVLTAVLPSLITGEWLTWSHRALNFLVVSCPCALVLSVPVAFISGIGNCARNNILVKGGTVLEKTAKTRCFVFDKTGTLTYGELKVSSIHTNSGTESELLSVCYALEKNSIHPVAKAICSFCESQNITSATAENIHETAGMGTVGLYNGKRIMAGNEKLMSRNGVTVTDNLKSSGSIIYVAEGTECLGYVEISDTLRPESKTLISNLKASGYSDFHILSGDRKEAAEHIADILDIENVNYSMLPLDKVSYVENIQKNRNCIFTGDGTNDGPVLATAGIGIAMGKNGSALAVQVADAVILNDNPLMIEKLVRVSSKTMKIIKQNIVLIMLVKIAFMAMGFAGITSPAMSAFADSGIAVIAVLNSLRALRDK